MIVKLAIASRLIPQVISRCAVYAHFMGFAAYFIIYLRSSEGVAFDEFGVVDGMYQKRIERDLVVFIYAIYLVTLNPFVSGINSAMSLRVKPSSKIFNIMFSVCVVTDWLFFNR